MKKFLLILLALIMCLSFVGCKDEVDEKDASSAESSVDNSLVGKYMLYAMSEGGESVDYATLALIGATNSYIEFKADGTFVLLLPEEDAINGTYDATASTLNGENAEQVISFTASGDFIILTVEDMVITFTKGKLPDVPDINLSDLVPDDSSSETVVPDESKPEESKPEESKPEESKPETDGEFVGDYVIESMSAEGVTVDHNGLKLLRMENSYLKINADGSFVFFFAGETAIGTYDEDAKTLIVDGDPAPYTFKNGKITINIDETTSLVYAKGEITEDETPDVSIDFSIPEFSVPEIVAPELSLPEFSIPEISIPEISIPEVSVPEVDSADKYMLYSMEVEGITLDQTAIAGAGMGDSYLALKADGTFVLALTGEEPVSGTYDATAKTLTAEGESISYTVDGNKVTLEVEGMYMTFAKAKASSDKDTKLAAGKYMIYSMKVEGIDYSLDVIKSVGQGIENSYLQINADGTFTMDLVGEGISDGTYDESAKTLTSEGESIPYTFEDGKITVVADDTYITFKK